MTLSSCFFPLPRRRVSCLRGIIHAGLVRCELPQSRGTQGLHYIFLHNRLAQFGRNAADSRAVRCRGGVDPCGSDRSDRVRKRRPSTEHGITRVREGEEEERSRCRGCVSDVDRFSCGRGTSNNFLHAHFHPSRSPYHDRTRSIYEVLVLCTCICTCTCRATRYDLPHTTTYPLYKYIVHSTCTCPTQYVDVVQYTVGRKNKTSCSLVLYYVLV